MADPSPTPGPVRRFARRWLRRLGAAGVLLAVLVYFAPTVAARIGLVNFAIGRATAGLNGSVAVGGASLGWFSAVELRDVRLADADGRTILAAPKVASSKSLLALAMNRSDLGTFTVERPQVEVVCEKGTTNAEQAVAKWLNEPSAGGGGGPAVGVRVADGSLTVVDADRNQSSVFSGVEVTVAVPRSGDGPIAVQFKAETTTPAGPGRIEADVTLGTGVELIVRANGFPLDAAGPVARRFEPGLSVGGRLTAELAASVGAIVRAAGVISVADLDVASPRLGGERLRLARLDLPCVVETANGRVKVEKADLSCDLGTASLAGTFDPNLPAERLAEQAGLTAAADVDVAKVAALFPRLLRLREGTALQEGRVKAKLASKAGPGGTVWEGGVNASALRGTRGGQPVVWDQPLEAAFAGRLGADLLPVFDRLECRAEFAAVTASGGVENFTATADVSLDRLAARLGEFVDLGGVKLAGSAKVQLANRPNGKGGSAVGGTVALRNFVLSDGTRNLNEPDLALEFAADGAFAGGPVRIDAGRVKTTAGADALEVTLLDPIPDVRVLQSGKATAKLVGDLARWRSRAAGFVAIPPQYVIGGVGTVAGTVRFDPQRISLDGLSGDLANVRFHGYGLKVDEPQFRLLPTEVVIDRASGVIDVPRLQAASQTVGVGAEKVRLSPLPDGTYNVSCAGVANVNLLRLQRLLQLQSDPALSDAVSGMVKGGTFTLDGAGTALRFKANLPVEQFVYGPPQKPAWAEPTLAVTAEGEYDLAADTLKLVSAKVERPNGLACQAAGTISQVTTDTALDLGGRVTYDLALLEPQLRNYLGQGVKAVGKDTREFRLSGKLSGGTTPVSVTLVDSVAKLAASTSGPLASLNGNASVAWQSLRAYGFDVGQAELKANLDRGLLKVDPIEATFGQTGKVRLEPTVNLTTPGYDMTLAKGKVIDRAKLTPAACADALGYALPAIARSTETEGTISFDLDDSRVPLADPDSGTVKGKLTLHNVQVGPGPLVTELATLFGAKQTKVTLANEQVVPVRLENGRVHHENLALTANGFTVRTTGSVGLDGGLQLVAEVPVPESAVGPLLRNNPKLREAVAAKRIKVPVGGTVGKPQVDQRAFQAAVRQYAEEVARDAARGKLNDVIEKGQDKLQKEIEKKLDKFLPLPPSPPGKKS